jgi:glycerol-3-phosphate dehydrogenase
LLDILIIGGGVVGCLIGRELSRYRLSILLVEKAGDIADGSTKANSAIVHAGFDAAVGSLKARFNVAGNALYDQVCKDLDVPFRRNGSVVLAFSEAELPHLRDLKVRGERNGVPGLELLTGDEVRRREPKLSTEVVEALYAPTGGIVGPWDLAVAAAENAMDNGMELLVDTEVTAIEPIAQGWRVSAGDRTFETRMVINAAGLYSDRIHNMVAEPVFTIDYRRGEYFVLDRSEGSFVDMTIFQCPSEKGKGVLISPTVHGNLIIGPNAQSVPTPEHTETSAAGLDEIRTAAARSAPGVRYGAVITSFAGLRCTPSTHDFIIGPVAGAPGFIDVAGVESPGLTSAPAIAVHVAGLVREHLGQVEARRGFNPLRRPLAHFNHLDAAAKAEWIRKDARYGRIVCRCESITEGEIVDAIHRNAGATTVDGVKRRLRPGMGRCQGGFCGPRVVEILARELGVTLTAVRKDGPASLLLTGATKNVDEAVHA